MTYALTYKVDGKPHIALMFKSQYSKEILVEELPSEEIIVGYIGTSELNTFPIAYRMQRSIELLDLVLKMDNKIRDVEWDDIIVLEREARYCEEIKSRLSIEEC